MTPDIEILREVDAIGGRVWLKGDRVRYSLPADRCDLVDRLRESKAEVLRLLRIKEQAQQEAAERAERLRRCDYFANLRDPHENSAADSPTIQGDSPAPACPAPVPDHRTLIQTDAAVAAAAHAFHCHLFGPGQATGCCAARHGRYCPEGARLREAYHTAHRQAEGRP